MDSKKLLETTIQIRYKKFIDTNLLIQRMYNSIFKNYSFPQFTGFNLPKNIMEIVGNEHLRNNPVFIIDNIDRGKFKILIGNYFISFIHNELVGYEDFIEEFQRLKLDTYIVDNQIIRIGQQFNIFYDNNENIFNMVNIRLGNKDIGDNQLIVKYVKSYEKFKNIIILANNQEIIRLGLFDKKNGSSFNIDTYTNDIEYIASLSIKQILDKAYTIAKDEFNELLGR